jgi:hypothetical protein
MAKSILETMGNIKQPVNLEVPEIYWLVHACRIIDYVKKSKLSHISNNLSEDIHELLSDRLVLFYSQKGIRECLTKTHPKIQKKSYRSS